MRIDKYLWSVRYYKTRNEVTEACKKGRVKVNGQIAKPSRAIFPTDTIVFRKDQITQIITVLAIPENRIGAKLVALYSQNDTPKEVYTHLEFVKLSKEQYRKTGLGRPTKKERRTIDEYTSKNEVKPNSE